MSNYYKHHPECRDGEVYLCALFREEDYAALPFASKRKGTVAYDVADKPMPCCFSVFISQSESVKTEGVKDETVRH